MEVADRIGILVGDVRGVLTRSLSLVVNVGPKLSSTPDCSESLLGVPIIGESVVGFDIRLFDRDTLVEGDPTATMPRSITDVEAPAGPALDSRRPGEIELRLLSIEIIVCFDVMLFLLGILEGELLALLTTCNNPF